MLNYKKIIRSAIGLKQSESISSLNIQRRFEDIFVKPFCKKKFKTEDVINVLKNFGIKKGSNIFIHSSWDLFYNYEGTPEELVQAVIDFIGPEGTIAMPAIPFIRKKTFDVRRTVTKAGIIPEVFRKHPGISRSANVRHSVCAIGPLANELTKDHHLSQIRFDENSPYYKICQLDFKVISMGLPSYFIGTIIHCVEATLYKEIPYFSKIYDTKKLVEQKYIGYDGVEHSYFEFGEKVTLRSDYYKAQYILWRYFDKSKIKKARLSGLPLSIVEAKYTYEKLCELARKGIVLYIYP